MTREIRFIRVLLAMYLVGLVGIWIAVWIATRQAKVYMFLGWFAAEVVTLFLFTLVALLERVFLVALGIRQANELTVN